MLYSCAFDTNMAVKSDGYTIWLASPEEVLPHPLSESKATLVIEGQVLIHSESDLGEIEGFTKIDIAPVSVHAANLESRLDDPTLSAYEREDLISKINLIRSLT